MRKTFRLDTEGKNRDRLLDAVKHEIRKYIKRERRRELPEGMDYWGLDCRFGLTAEAAQPVHEAELIGQLDTAAREGANAFYVEILARPAKRNPRAAAPGAEPQT